MHAAISGALLRQARLQRDWSQEGLCRGICAVSYLSKIEQGKVEASGEILRQLFARKAPPPRTVQFAVNFFFQLHATYLTRP